MTKGTSAPLCPYICQIFYNKESICISAMLTKKITNPRMERWPQETPYFNSKCLDEDVDTQRTLQPLQILKSMGPCPSMKKAFLPQLPEIRLKK